MQFVSLWEDEFFSFLLFKTNKILSFLMVILRKSSSSEGPDFKTVLTSEKDFYRSNHSDRR